MVLWNESLTCAYKCLKMSNSGLPLYKKIVDFYTKKILCQELAPDVRMDSIVRIMSRHKVSRDTAKRVLTELSEKGYIRKIVGKGSFVTSSTQVKKTVICSSDTCTNVLQKKAYFLLSSEERNYIRNV